MNYKIYFINLDRSKDRLIEFNKEIAKTKIPSERISAIDAKNLEGNEFIINNKYNRELLLPEVGCYLSHIKAKQEFLKSKNEYAIILEDDIVLSSDFEIIVEKFINNHQFLENKHKWDVLKLYNGKRNHIKIQTIYNEYILGHYGTTIPISTMAAIWTRKGAEKFLNNFKNNVPIIQRPIDCDLQHPWEFNLLIYNVLPSIVSHPDNESNIRITKPYTPIYRRVLFEIKRFFPKYIHYIKQHGFSAFYHSFIAKKNQKIL